MPTPVEAFFKQSAWATERLLEVCERLSDEQLDTSVEGTYSSIRRTFLHALAAEQYYLSRLDQAVTPEFTLDATFPGFEALKRVARENGELLAGAAAESSADLTVPGGSGDEFTETTQTVFLVQALTHSAEHRTQILTMLTSLGAGPTDLDAQIDGWSWGAASGELHSKD